MPGEQLPKIDFADQSHDLAELRVEPTHAPLVAAVEADRAQPLPDVQLTPNPDWPGRRSSYDDWPVDVRDASGEVVGHVNPMQKGDSMFIRGIDMGERKGEGLGAATYVALSGLAHSVGRRFTSDPGGLTESSNGVWESLVRQGIAEPVPDAQDMHGFPRYAIKPPEQTPPT